MCLPKLPSLALLAAVLLAFTALHAQEVRPPVRDQNRSGAPQTARKPQPADSATEAAEAFEKGMAALEAEKYAEAAEALGKATRLAPENVGCRFYLAQALALAGNPEESIPHYELLVEAQPDVAEIRSNYAQVLSGLDRHAEAAQQLRRASELKPGDAAVLFQLGSAELRSGEHELALTRFEALVKQNPEDADHHYGLAQSAFLAKDLATAETSFREAARLDPRYRDGLLALAEAWEEQGKLEKAVDILKEFPENPDATRWAGELLVELGKAEEALSSLESALESAPTFENRRNLATAYRRAGKHEKAIATLEAALVAEPENIEAHMTLGRVLRDNRQFPQAAARFFAATKLEPANSSAWNEYAGACLLAGDYQASMNAIAEIEKQGKLVAGHHYMRAIILDRFQNDELALREYELFLTMSDGQNEDEEFKARQRVRMLNNKKRR